MAGLPRLRSRSDQAELMDGPDVAPGELEANLRELEWTNRWFGANASLKNALRPLLTYRGARVLDVGTGSGGTFAEVGAWATSQGAAWTLVGLDRSARNLGLGRHHESLPCAADAMSLPFADDSFDAVISLQTLHHLDDAEVVTALQEMVRVSRRLVVVSDLRRGLIPYLGARALAATFWRNRLTRHDGPVSVQRAFTTSELHQLGSLGGDAYTVKRHGLFRLVLTVECGGAPAKPMVPETGVLA